MKLCSRCGKPIRPGQAYETRDIATNSGPGATVCLHKALCVRPPTQTAPVSRRGLIRD